MGNDHYLAMIIYALLVLMLDAVNAIYNSFLLDFSIDLLQRYRSQHSSTYTNSFFTNTNWGNYLTPLSSLNSSTQALACTVSYIILRLVILFSESKVKISTTSKVT